jgi:hypothetical protein
MFNLLSVLSGTFLFLLTFAGPAVGQTPSVPQPRLESVQPQRVALKTEVKAKITGIDDWLVAHPDERGRIVLVLNGHQLKNVRGRHVGPDELSFTLRRTTESRDEWAALLGHPGLEREVRVQVAVDGQQAFAGALDGRLDTLDWSSALWAGAAFLVLVAAFLVISRKSDLLREGLAPASVDDRRPYSLGRTQMAVWFFITIASFVFIWIVTGSYDPLTPSVLGLIGISAGTALSAAVIDRNKESQIDNRAAALARQQQQLEADVAALRTATAELQRTIANAPTGFDPTASLAQIIRNEADVAANLTKIQQIQTDLAKISGATPTRKSGGFFDDILSDEGGVSFHRFQIAVWTLILSVIFVYTVYESLAMPEFDAKLLGLMGISSGTYLGFKIPEEK